MSDKTVTIIGAGLGGLVVGALLAKEGLKVTVVEKNHHVGGGLQSYKRFGTTFDTGMHIFGGMRPGGNIRRICEYLDILDKFEVKELDAETNLDVYVEKTDETYSLSFDSDKFVDSFSKYFPEQKSNLIAYQQVIDQIMDTLDLFHLRQSTHKPDDAPKDFILAANDLISKYITDEKLQSLLAIVNTLYAGEANISPAFLHAAITKIFMNGACRVAGGYSNFADALVDFITAHEGEVIVDAPIEKINTAGSRVSSVTTKSGLTLSSDYYVSAIPVTSMIGMMDDDSVLSHVYKTAMYSKVPSLSAFIVNIKLKKDTIPYSNRIGFYLQDYDSVWKAYDGGRVQKFMFMTPPVIGQGEYAESLNVILPMHWSVVAQWEDTKVGQRGNDYLEFKHLLCKEIINKLKLMAPNIVEAIEAIDTSSPLTIRDYTGVSQGAMCGVRNDCHDPLTFMPVVTRVPNLFVTGQNINMHGFCGVTLTAIQTSEAILGKGYIIDKINAATV